MSLIGTLKFETLFQILKESCANADRQSVFESSFATHLLNTGKLLAFTLPTSEQYISALKYAISQSGLKLDAVAQRLVDTITGSFKSKVPVKKKTVQSSSNLSLSNSKIQNSSIVMVKDSKVSTSVPTLPTAADRLTNQRLAKIRELGSKSKDQVQADLERFTWDHKRLYTTCKEKCEMCQSIFREVPLTKCTHPNPCVKSGMFPHLTRTTLLALHSALKVSDLACVSKHYKNPLVTVKPPTTTAKPIEQSSQQAMYMDTCPSYGLSASSSLACSRKRAKTDTGRQPAPQNPQNAPQYCPCGATLRRNSRGNRNCPISNCPKWAAAKTIGLG